MTPFPFNPCKPAFLLHWGMAGFRVLIADDDSLIRHILRAALERRGHDVVDASDGNELIERLRSGDLDLCIMDASMPGPSLEERLATMKSRVPNMAVLVVSGYSDLPGGTVNNTERFRFIQKPIDLATLSTTLDELGITATGSGD